MRNGDACFSRGQGPFLRPRAPWRRRAAFQRLARLLAVLAVSGLPIAAAAVDPFARGIDPVSFKLAPGTGAYLTLEGADGAPARTVRLVLAADLTAGLMSLRIGDTKVDELIRNRLDLHLLGAWAITDAFELGLDLPVTAWQRNGFDALAERTGFTDTAPASAGLGDLRLFGRYRILSQSTAPLSLAALAEVRAPSGDQASFLGERGFMIAPRLVAERAVLEDLSLALTAGYRWRSAPGRYLNLYVGDELELALAGRYRLPSLSFLEGWSLNAELLMATPARAPFTAASADALKTPLEGLLGARADLGGGFSALLGGGMGLGGPSGLGRTGWRVFTAVGWQQTIPVAAEPVPEPDTDGDGLVDSKDRCPTEPGPPEYDGCPDSDGDMIPDLEDECPTEPGPATNNGCPADPPYAVFESGSIQLRDAVNFDTGKASIKPESYPVLDAVAKILEQHPEITKVRIDGHTDSQGSDVFNLNLSERRSESVMSYIVARGIAPERLSAKGFGEGKPVAPNVTALGRAKNRRVEFTILEPSMDTGMAP